MNKKTDPLVTDLFVVANQKGYSIDRLAETASVELPLLKKIQEGRQTPSLRILRKLLDALELELHIV